MECPEYLSTATTRSSLSTQFPAKSGVIFTEM